MDKNRKINSLNENKRFKNAKDRSIILRENYGIPIVVLEDFGATKDSLNSAKIMFSYSIN